MGCLVEFFYEFVFELILEGWLALMMLIVPQKMNSKKTQKIIKAIVGLFAITTLITMFVGLFSYFDDNEFGKTTGIYLFFIPLTLSLIQISIGIIIRIKKKKNNS